MKPAQLELPLPSPGPTKLDTWIAQTNPRKEALRRHDRDEKPYNPRALRHWFIQHLSHTEWTGFIDLPDQTGYSCEAVDRVLDLLERRGRIEKTPLYFYPCAGLVKPDRTIHPGHGKNCYHGFEFGYRLRTKQVRKVP